MLFNLENKNFSDILKDKKLLVEIGLVIASIIFAFKLYSLQHSANEEYKKILVKEKEKMNLIQELVNLENRNKDTKDIFNKKDASEVMRTISGLAKEANLNIINIKPQEEDKGFYTVVSLRINLSANSYHDLVKFIKSVETNEERYKVAGLTIKSAASSEVPAKKILNVEILIVRFSFQG